MIDTHAHILSEYYDDIDTLIEFLKKNNVNKVINCSTGFKDIEEVLNLSKKYKNFLYSAIGIHPENINDFYDIDKLENLIKENKIIAIGEIGLDYYWNKENKEEQKKLFIKQLELAEKYNLPVIIHIRESMGECYEILKHRKLKGIIHCFTGSYEMAKNFIDLGYKLGVGGVLTFKNSKLYQVIEKIRIDNVVLETDSPYLSPEPLRGKINTSANIKYIVEKLSYITGVSDKEIIKITNQNALSIFDI